MCLTHFKLVCIIAFSIIDISLYKKESLHYNCENIDYNMVVYTVLLLLKLLIIVILS